MGWTAKHIEYNFSYMPVEVRNTGRKLNHRKLFEPWVQKMAIHGHTDIFDHIYFTTETNLTASFLVFGIDRVEMPCSLKPLSLRLQFQRQAREIHNPWPERRQEPSTKRC